MKPAFTLALAFLLACRSTPPAALTPYAPAFAGATFEKFDDRNVALYRRHADGATMILVAGGNFFMAGREWYLPPYLIDEDPITIRRYYAFLKKSPPPGTPLDLPAAEMTEEEAEAYARSVGAQPPSAAHLQKAGMPGACRERYRDASSRWIVKDGPGVRCVLEQPLLPSTTVEWRPDWWSALEEARRRNAIVFLTMHWDG